MRPDQALAMWTSMTWRLPTRWPCSLRRRLAGLPQKPSLYVLSQLDLVCNVQHIPVPLHKLSMQGSPFSAQTALSPKARGC